MPVLLFWLFQLCFPYQREDDPTASLLQGLVSFVPPRDGRLQVMSSGSELELGACSVTACWERECGSMAMADVTAKGQLPMGAAAPA